MFSLRGESAGGRLGCLVTQKGTLQTPTLLLSMRKGDVHGLTPETLKTIHPSFGMILDSLDL